MEDTASTTVTTDRTSYQPGDAITVAFANRSAGALVVQDHESGCTFARLERQTATDWQAQQPCRLLIATRLLPVAAGATATATVHPPATGWPRGMYRAAVRFHPPGASAGLIAVSATFEVVDGAAL